MQIGYDPDFIGDNIHNLNPTQYLFLSFQFAVNNKYIQCIRKNYKEGQPSEIILV